MMSFNDAKNKSYKAAIALKEVKNKLLDLIMDWVL